MNINLFNNRAYIINTPSFKSSSEKFLRVVLDKLGASIDIKNLDFFDTCLNYDTYSITSSDNKFYLLKISFDINDKYLKREANILKKLKGYASGKFITLKKIQITEEIVCSLIQFPNSLSLKNLGRTFIIQNSDALFKTHQYLCDDLQVNRGKTSYLKELFDECNFTAYFDTETKANIDKNSDYKCFEKIYKDLAKDLEKHLPELSSYKTCLGNMSINSIYLKENLIFFDKLDNFCNFHPFIDLCDLILEMGLTEAQKNLLIKSFIESYKDASFADFNNFFAFAVRKKLLQTISTYLREIYFLKFLRAEHITECISQFHNNLNYFKKIPIFIDNKDFILKSLTEPILGAKK